MIINNNWIFKLNPNCHEAEQIYPLYNSLIGFCQLNFYQKFTNIFEVKIEINRDNLTPCQAHRVIKNLILGCPEDENFSYFHCSCQLGLNSIKTLSKFICITMANQVWMQQDAIKDSFILSAKIYIQSAPNKSNETYTFMCLGRAGRFGQL